MHWQYVNFNPAGFEANAAVTCPESLLFSGDYLYLNNDGTFDCNGTTDVMDVCTDSTAVTYDYSKCSQRIGYSGRVMLVDLNKNTCNNIIKKLRLIFKNAAKNLN